MKDFIKKIVHKNLNNLINEDDSARNITAYHGTKDKINKFQFVNAPDAKNQEGPGIYFTINHEDAKNYAGDGGYVYTVQLTPKRLLRNTPMNKVDKNQLRDEVVKLIKMAPNWKSVAMNYGDDLEDGLDGMLYQYIDTSNIKRKVFVYIFEDLYKTNPDAYIKNMIKLGYDGVYLKSKDGLRDNYAIYNPAVIKLVKTEQI
jgi:hypothetical protein